MSKQQKAKPKSMKPTKGWGVIDDAGMCFDVCWYKATAKSIAPVRGSRISRVEIREVEK